MPTYKLYYFPVRARAEPARLVFAAAGVDFEDIRIPIAEWSKHKHNMPFRQLPMLEVDGKKLAQSNTIVRYLANELGFAGKDKWETAEADQLAETVEDLIIPIVKIHYEKDEAVKAQDLQKLKDKTAPNILQGFETRLSNSSSGFLVGDGLTYADLCFMNLLDFMEGILRKPDEDAKGIISKYPNAQKHRQKIASLPKIAVWIKNRPDDAF